MDPGKGAANMTSTRLILAVVLLFALGGCESTGSLQLDDDDHADDDDDTSVEPAEDLFEVSANGHVDVLFVVDNSCSMMEEQAALQAYFPVLLAQFIDTNVDYHIGITVLDDYQGQPEIGRLYGSTPYIDTTTPDPEESFAGNMTMGADGYGSCEAGLDASHRALSEPLVYGYNAGFYRPEADLIVVIVSDEDDASHPASECPEQEQYMGVDEYVPWLTTLKTGEANIYFAAIVGDDPGGCSSSWGDAERGTGYHEVVSALGPQMAQFASICEHDWSEAMGNLATVASPLELAYPLTGTPQPGTLEVYLDLDGPGESPEFDLTEDPSYSIPYAYAYDEDSNAVVFTQETLPPVGAVIRAYYLLVD